MLYYSQWEYIWAYLTCSYIYENVIFWLLMWICTRHPSKGEKKRKCRYAKKRSLLCLRCLEASTQWPTRISNLEPTWCLHAKTVCNAWQQKRILPIELYFITKISIFSFSFGSWKVLGKKSQISILLFGL